MASTIKKPAPSVKANVAPLSTHVAAVLAEDARFRRPGVKEDLLKFDQIQFGREWDNSLPTLVTQFTYSKARVQRATLDQFRAAFFRNFPELRLISWNGVFIAGGCVGHHLIADNDFDGDVDIFVHGLTREQADRKVFVLVKELIAARKQLQLEALTAQEKQAAGGGGGAAVVGGFGGGGYRAAARYVSPMIDLKIIRNANGISLFIDRRLYQIIFRLYASPSEVLHGFDIGSSAVGFDGNDLLFTTLSKFSYEFLCNIIDTGRRSTTYESRFQKYFQRGFKMILPYFDISKLRTAYLPFQMSEMILMPFLKVSYRQVEGNQIVVQQFHSKRDESSGEVQQKTDYALDEVDEYNLLYINMNHLLTDPSKLYHFMTTSINLKGDKIATTSSAAAGSKKKKKRRNDDDDDDNEDDDEGDGEEGDEDAIDEDKNDDDEGGGDDDEGGGDDDDDDDAGRKKRKRGASAKAGKKDKPADESVAIDKFFNEPPFLSISSVSFFYSTLRKKAYEKKMLAAGRLEKYITVESIASIMKRIYIDKEDINKVLDDVIKRQEAYVVQLLHEHATTSRGFPWIITDPGTQLTSSINPIIAAPQDWYGEYYKK